MASSLQRVLDAIALKKPDKVPFHSYASPELVMQEAGHKVHEMYLDPEMFFESMVASHRLYQEDYVGVRLDPYLIAEQLTHSYESRDLESLDELRFTSGVDGLVIHRKRTGEELGRVSFDSKTAIPLKRPPPLVQSAADIEKILIVPWQELVQRPRWSIIARYVKLFGGERFINVGVGATSANLLDMYLGTERALIAALIEPDLCRAIIDRHFEQLKERIQAARAVGVNGVTTGDACASCSFFSPNTYRDLFFPAHKRAIDFIHEQGLLATLHICGRVSPILDWMSQTGADIIEGLDPASAGGDVVLGDAKRRVGKRRCLKGNLDAVHVILPGPAEEVYRVAREAIEAAGPGGFIFSTEQIPRGTPREHVLAMVQARDDAAASTRQLKG